MISSEFLQEQSLPEDLPVSFVREVLRDFDLTNQENVRFVDLSKNIVAPPPYGYLIGEDQFAVGDPKLNPQSRFLYTRGLIHCTGVAMTDTKNERALLAHVAASRGIADTIAMYADKFEDPSQLNISIVPGFLRNNLAEQRIRQVVTSVLTLSPQTISIDLAHGDPKDLRDIMLEATSGTVAQVVKTHFANPNYTQV